MFEYMTESEARNIATEHRHKLPTEVSHTNKLHDFLNKYFGRLRRPDRCNVTGTGNNDIERLEYQRPLSRVCGQELSEITF